MVARLGEISAIEQGVAERAKAAVLGPGPEKIDPIFLEEAKSQLLSKPTGGDLFSKAKSLILGEQPVGPERDVTAPTPDIQIPETLPPRQIEPTIDVGAQAVLNVFENLINVEGASGDKVTGVVTGKIGVTAAAKRTVDPQGQLEDEEVAERYLAHLDNRWSETNPNYLEAPLGLREAILDTSYNLGEGTLKFKGLNSALNSKDWESAARSLLDTANVAGKSMKGIAKRRALEYNKVALVKVAAVEQEKDGTIKYLDEHDNVIFQYTPRSKQHHPKSPPGRLEIEEELPTPQITIQELS